MVEPDTMRNATHSLTVLLGALLFAGHELPGHAQSPTSQPLVQQADFHYLGSFALPSNDGSGATTGDLTYGGTAMGLSPSGGLLVAGHDWYQRLCEVSIPAVNGTATIRQRCTDVTEGRLPQIDENDIKLGGSLVYNGRLIVSAWSYYDADGDQAKSHFASGTTFATTGDVTGPVQVGTAPAGFVSGYMGVIPAEWRALLGGPALTGNCCTPIISRTSSGPAVSVFNPDDIGRVTPVPATQLLGYPLSTPLADANTSNPYYTRSDFVGGLAFPAGTRSVLFIGRHGAGQPCYGEAAACADSAGAYKGEHAYPYVTQVWAYDANDLAAVKTGALRPHELRPYGVFRLSEINNSGSATNAGATYDPTTKRLYVTERYSDRPRVHVYEITAGTAVTPTPSVEVCGDGIDNDGDGQVDEGCTTPNPPPAPTPEICGDGIDNDHDGLTDEGCTTTPPPPPPAEVCGDNIDNDHDGLVDEGCAPTPPEICGDAIDNNANAVIDEGCPGAPQRLEGKVSNATVSLSWLAPISGTVPTQYIVEAGLAPGETIYTTSSASTSSRTDNVGNGKYYVRARAVNAAGKSVPSNEVVVSVGCTGSPNALQNLITKVRGKVVTMTWTDPDGCSDTSYRVALSDRPSGPALAETATDSNALTGFAGPGVYYARATTVTDDGEIAPSIETRFVVDSTVCTPPQFATELGAHVVGSFVALSWNPTNIAEALALDAVAPLIYVFEAGTGPGLTDIIRAPVGRTTFGATYAPSGTYYARVRPADMCGLGAVSNEVIIRVP